MKDRDIVLQKSLLEKEFTEAACAFGLEHRETRKRFDRLKRVRSNPVLHTTERTALALAS